MRRIPPEAEFLRSREENGSDAKGRTVQRVYIPVTLGLGECPGN